MINLILMMIMIFIGIAITILLFTLVMRGKPQQQKKMPDKFPYYRKNLLTKNEWVFFKKLKEITDRNNLHILSKVRLIDLVDVNDNLPYKEKMSYKARIIQKHIDFVLVNPDSFKVYIAIELDDSSHDTKERKERDEFLDKVCENAKLPLIHCRSTEGIEDKIVNIMKNI